MLKYMLLTENGTSGTYWAGLPTTDPGDGGNYRDRYHDGSGYRVFSRMFDFYNTVLKNEKSFRDDIVLEIQGKWDDSYSAYTAGDLSGFHSVTITTMVNGARDQDSYHGGKIGGGYRRVDSYGVYAIRAISPGVTIDGIEMVSTRTSTSTVVFDSSGGLTVKNCIIGASSADGSIGIQANGPGGTIENCIIFGAASKGIVLQPYRAGSVVQNCLVFGCGIGVEGTNHSSAFIANCVILDCTTNWGGAPSSGFYHSNAGESGDAVWDSDSSAVIISSSDFENYENPPTSSTDLAPAGDSAAHTSSSALTDAGSQVYQSFSSGSINGLDRPSYKNGAATEWDIGPFEFDWGYGLAPATVLIDITGMIEGSVLAIYRTSDHAEIVGPTVIGASGAYSTTYSWAGNVSITVVVRKATGGTKYLPYSAPGLITSGGFGLVVSQVEDMVLNG